MFAEKSKNIKGQVKKIGRTKLQRKQDNVGVEARAKLGENFLNDKQ